jgi:2-polyprenyl-3-methyl-5-hydroxy-6-metoxy-1,4-benzoquinol methylase
MAHWDALMDQSSQYSVYLGGTIWTDISSAMTAALIKWRAPKRPSVLDVGCAAGELATALATVANNYLGIDVSSRAIEIARSMCNGAGSAFEVCDIRQFKLSARWDVIVFNEILYYLSPTDEAAEQVRRYAEALSPAGIVIVSMKNDAKSRAIFRLLLKQFELVDALLWQQKSSAQFAISIDQECPAFLVVALKRRSRPSTHRQD